MTVEAYLPVSTDAGVGFDGIVDPAGLFDSAGKHLDGLWTTSGGGILGFEFGEQTLEERRV